MFIPQTLDVQIHHRANKSDGSMAATVSRPRAETPRAWYHPND
jgi:hypothetical protein